MPKNMLGGSKDKPEPMLYKNGEEAEPSDMKNEMAIADHWMDTLKRQRERKSQGGNFHDGKRDKLRIAEHAIGRAMEKSGAETGTIKTWIGKDKYDPPDEPDPELERAWGKKLDEREKNKMEKSKKTIIDGDD